MKRRFDHTPADDIGADLEPVWDRLASHASAAPGAARELNARVQGALLSEFDRTLRPTANRPLIVVRPLVRSSSLRSLAAAAALLALLGASVALAGAGVARLQERPAAVPTPAVEEPSDDDGPAPIVQPPTQSGPDQTDDEDDEDGIETPEPDVENGGDDDADETPEADDDRDEDETPEPDDDRDEDEFPESDDDPSDEPEEDRSDDPEGEDPD